LHYCEIFFAYAIAVALYKSHRIKKIFIEKTQSACCRNLLFVRIHIQRHTINLSQSKSFSRERQTRIHSNTIGNHSRPAG